MRCGIYGKLPAKRDFVATGAPREFLSAWEPWLQGGISASRALLGADWQAAFLRAPIWRFWIGEDIVGAATIGALMPSVDGVGRYFPLTVFARAEPGETLHPPGLDSHDAWLAAAEELLLSALAEGASFEALTAALGRTAPPAPSASPSLPDGAARIRGGTMIAEASPSSFADLLPRLRMVDGARLAAGEAYWWTIGGENFPPRILLSRRMPDPYLFAGMLTGRFEEAAS